jgi:ABC-type branched-subunit amino acid transport system ATPase component
MHRQGRREIEELLRSLVEEGMTILLIEHNMQFVMSLCSMVTVINFGRTVVTGTPEDVGRHPRVIAVYLGGNRASA